MYLTDIEGIGNKTIVRIKYDCCGKEHEMFFYYAKKNFDKNNGKHICRICWLKSDDNPAKRKEVSEKIKQTNIERYGNACSMNSKKYIEERQNFSEEKKKQIAEKRKLTCFERYGTTSVLADSDVIKKIKQTMIEKYGVDNPNKSSEILEKRAQTNLERYGNKCSLHSPEIEKKTIQTMIKKYGVEKYNQLPEMKEYLRENCKKWLKECWGNGGSMKGKNISEEAKEILSRKAIDRIISGQFKPFANTGKGYFPSEKCNRVFYLKSSYEFEACKILENNEEVEFYDVEPFYIKYEFDGSIHRYAPDLIIKFKNINKLVIIEIKPKSLIDDPKNIAKINKAKRFAEENDMIFEVWTEKELEI